jgi:hypothetical protein
VSTLPRPTGKDSFAPWNAQVSSRNAHEEAITTCGILTVEQPSFLVAARTLGLGLLRKILADCGIKPQQLEDLL